MKNDRLSRLRKLFTEKGACAILVTKEVNVHYFSGFRGDSTALLITPDKEYLITDSRYTEQAEQQTKYQIVEQKQGLWKKIAELVETEKIKRLAFEGNALIFDDHAALQELLPHVKINVPLSLDGLRAIKEPGEIELIKKAIAISDMAFDHILGFIRPGISEIDVAAEMEDFMRKHGSERPAFTTIVASGERGSLPHGIASEKLIKAGEFVTMDFGAVYAGYHSDITRTICMGKATEKQKELYDMVLKAHLMGIADIKCGENGKVIDAPSRKFILDYIEAHHEGAYGHGLGHGVGLEIHELPRLSPSAEKIMVEENMLVTVEPGVYIKGYGGLRIEDTVLVTKDGGKPLTQARKDLIELDI